MQDPKIHFSKMASKAGDLSAVTLVRANLPHQVSGVGRVAQRTQNTKELCQASPPRADVYFEPWQ